MKWKISRGGAIVKKELKERWHSCECGCELHRDVNAAINILFVALTKDSEWVSKQQDILTKANIKQYVSLTPFKIASKTKIGRGHRLRG